MRFDKKQRGQPFGGHPRRHWLLQALLVGLNHLLERVTRTTSEILKGFVHLFPCGELHLEVQGAGSFRSGVDFVDILVYKFLVDEALGGVPLGVS